MADCAGFITRQSLGGGNSCEPEVVCDSFALAKTVWTAWATICSMLAGVKVGMLDGMLVILLVGATLGLDSLKISGFKHLKQAPVNCAVGFVFVEVDQCSGRGDNDCHQVRPSSLMVPGTLCPGVLGKGCSSGLSACSGLQGQHIACSRQLTYCL